MNCWHVQHKPGVLCEVYLPFQIISDFSRRKKHYLELGLLGTTELGLLTTKNAELHLSQSNQCIFEMDDKAGKLYAKQYRVFVDSVNTPKGKIIYDPNDINNIFFHIFTASKNPSILLLNVSFKMKRFYHCFSCKCSPKSFSQYTQLRCMRGCVTVSLDAEKAFNRVMWR